MTPATVSPPDAPERVLSTLNKDGSRRWLRPRVSSGRFLTGRRIVAYLLMVLFTALPYVRIAGRPAILLDLPAREFTLFGTTFLPTDTLLLALLVLTLFLAIFLVTALLGRVWCGWACPQTVYMEFLYRPIERLFEGRRYRSGGKASVHPLRLIAKYAVFLVLSLVLAHTFLAYFVGTEQLFAWMRRSPLEHPTAFLIVAFTTGLMMFDFCFFREQVCTLMCPYGRMQSVLLDRQSLIVSYDPGRGEPRGKKRKGDADGTASTRGDCIDCHLCVTTCPTGIDIREGLQMECIGCAQCIDACDEVMDRIGTPRGLIRYSSQERIETGRSRLLRPRVLIYPVLLLVVATALGVALASRSTIDVAFLRHRGTPYTVLDDGSVQTRLLLKVTNRSDGPRTYDITLPDGTAMTSADLPLALDAGEDASITLLLTVARDRFERGRAELDVVVADDAGATETARRHVLGPLFGNDTTTGE